MINVESYRYSPAMNYSKIKLLQKGWDYYKWNKDKKIENKGITIGSLVDYLVTYGRFKMFDNYYILQGNEITDSIKNVIDKVFENLSKGDITDETKKKIASLELSNFKDLISVACNECNYQNNWKEATRINKILEEGTHYFDKLKESTGKILISFETYTTAIKIYESLVQEKLICNKDIYQPKKNEKIFFQKPLYFTILDVEVKALPDLIKVQEYNGFAKILIYDYKTTRNNVFDFPQAVKDFRYDLQASIYTDAVIHNLKEFTDEKDVQVMFGFIVQSTTEINEPIVYDAEKILHIGRYGTKNKKFLGYINLLEHYKFYTKNEKKGGIMQNGKIYETLQLNPNIYE